MDEKGLYGKYRVEKTDGTPIAEDADYFVLRLDTDENARSVLWEYVELIQFTSPQLADELRARLRLYRNLDNFD